jgi:hypothetical protein
MQEIANVRCAEPTLEGATVREVPARLEQLDNRIEYLHSVLTDLEQRLAPVLAPAPCDPNCKQDVAAGNTTYGSALIRLAVRVEDASNRVQALTAMVEV